MSTWLKTFCADLGFVGWGAVGSRYHDFIFLYKNNNYDTVKLYIKKLNTKLYVSLFGWSDVFGLRTLSDVIVFYPCTQWRCNFKVRTIYPRRIGLTTLGTVFCSTLPLSFYFRDHSLFLLFFFTFDMISYSDHLFRFCSTAFVRLLRVFLIWHRRR